ncbi:MAG: ABC transporter permease [Marinilabiliaceae bacterium]
MKRIKYLMSRYYHDVIIAVEAITANKLKSFLTALGIMFGVAAVISMLAIGRGAQEEVLEQIKMVGVNNIIVSPSDMTVEGDDRSGSGDDTERFSPGLTLIDAQSIEDILPTVSRLSPVVSINYHAVLGGKSYPVTLEGVSSSYFDLLNIELASGKIFSEKQSNSGLPVAVIGDNIRNRFFNTEDPIGKHIKCGETWVEVIGVIGRRDFTASASDELGISSTDNKIIVPVKTMLRRFKDRARVNPEVLEEAARGGGNDEENGEENGEVETMEDQLDKIIVQVDETEVLSASADVIRRILLRRHSNIFDFEVTVPELLLKQQQRTNDIFNIVLGAIASISLIVGGIGIMNIMLASVWERVREIGTRQAIGASRKDIIVQFLSESVLISVTGGMIGVVLGVAMAHMIHVMADIKTIVTFYSVIIAFGVSATVGIVFGYLPAKRAAEQDPVESLRH